MTSGGERRGSDRWTRPGSVVTAVTTAGTLLAGWFAIFSSRLNGDEGYLLLSLREWTMRGALYDRVFSQYGPFYYAVFGTPARLLGVDWNVAAGRTANLLLWVAAAALFGLAIRTVTGRWELGVAAQIVAFSMLATLVNESMHPGALLCVLLAGLVANVAWFRPRRPARSDLVSGALLAATVCTKGNVGGFATVAFLFAATRAASAPWRWLGSTALVVLGPALLLAGGGEAWRWQWSMVYGVAALAVVVSAGEGDRPDAPRWPRLSGGRVLAGATAVAAVSLGIALVTGTSLGGLVDGMVVRPAQHPDFVTIAVRLPTWTWAWGLLGAALVAGWLAVHDRRTAPWRARTLRGPAWGVARVVAGLALLVSVLDTNDTAQTLFRAGPRLALLPLVALVQLPVAPDVRSVSERVSRTLLAALAVTEPLHAFPVPGSQVSWGLVVAGVLAVVVVGDGCRQVLAERTVPVRAVAIAAAAMAVLTVAVVPFGVRGGVRAPGDQLRAWVDAYGAEPRLDVPGAGPVRVPAAQRDLIHGVVPVLTRRCSTVLPIGADLWWYAVAPVPPPTGLNHPGWLSYLSDGELERDRRAFERSPRPCLLLSPTGGRVLGDRLVPSVLVLRRPFVLALMRARWDVVAAPAGVSLLAMRR